MYSWLHLRRRRGSPSMHLTLVSLILASEWSRSSFGKASRMMRHLGSRLTRRIGACSSPPFASANFGWAARASFFLFLTLALLAVTPHYSHPHPLPRSEARESNKATWVVAYLVLLLVLALLSPSFLPSFVLPLSPSLSLSMDIDFSTRMYPPRDGRFSLTPRSIHFPSQSHLVSSHFASL